MAERPLTPQSAAPEAQKPAVSDLGPREAGSCFEPPAGVVLRLPATCANCAEPAGASARLQPPFGTAGRAILVPYCARCARRLEQHQTRRAVGFGVSFLAGLVAALGLPLATAPLGMFTYGAFVTLASAAPLVLVWLASKRRLPEPGQSSAEVALWWDKRGICGSNSKWVLELAALNRSSARAEEASSDASAPSPPDYSAGLLAVRPLAAPRGPEWRALSLPLTFAGISPSVFQWLFPTLVVLNLSPSEFDLVVDGTNRGAIGVTSLESSSAAARFPLGAGSHVIEARPRGEGVDVQVPTYRVEVSINAGQEYLFAPGSSGYCFWLERTVYGGADSKSRTQPLGGKDGFFRIPSPIDTWFGANPAPNADQVSTGGEMVALRQGRCQ